MGNDSDNGSTWDSFAEAIGMRLDRPSKAVANALEAAQIIEEMEHDDRMACIAMLRALARPRSN